MTPCTKLSSSGKRLWQRLTRNGKVRRKQAVVALARKLLVRCWAMLRDGTEWRDDPAGAVARVMGVPKVRT